jgi:hypothetical protein
MGQNLHPPNQQPILKISKISVSKLIKYDVINYISISYTVFDD